MTFKAFLFSISLLAVYPLTNAMAASKNLCDDMIASGKSTDEQIAKCIAKFGESDTYKKNIQKKKWQQTENELKSQEEAARKSNIDVKKFSNAELDEAGFGKPFFAVRIDWKDVNNPKEKRITEGDALCKYLGYEKALKSVFSENEVLSQNANKNGFIIDTNIFGSAKNEPELFENSDERFTYRTYVEVTCAKIISEKIDGTAKILKEAVEDTSLKIVVEAPKRSDDKSVNDGPRKPAGEQKTTPFSYKPEYTEDKESTMSR